MIAKNKYYILTYLPILFLNPDVIDYFNENSQHLISIKYAIHFHEF